MSEIVTLQATLTQQVIPRLAEGNGLRGTSCRAQERTGNDTRP